MRNQQQPVPPAWQWTTTTTTATATALAAAGPRPPSLATFATYEDMQTYFDQRNQRRLRHLANPGRDSYVDAFNRHNEQPAGSAAPSEGPVRFAPLPRVRRQATPTRTPSARHERRLPNEPKMLVRFEIADAVEPSDAVKALVRQHRGRNMRAQAMPTQGGSQNSTKSAATTTTAITTTKEATKAQEAAKSNSPTAAAAATTTTTTARTAAARKSTPAKREPPVVAATPPTTGRRAHKRTRRSLDILQQHQQLLKEPHNFQVRLIPFEASDAREPDAALQRLIKQARSLDQGGGEAERGQHDDNKQAPGATSGQAMPAKRSKKMRSKEAKRLRAKRSAPVAPQMFKFQLEDARQMGGEPHQQHPQQHPQQQQQQHNFARQSKELRAPNALLTNERQAASSQNVAQPDNRNRSEAMPVERSPNASTNLADVTTSDNQAADQSAHESKRYFVYKEAPGTMPLPKKSLNSLPHGLQKVITQLLKDPKAGRSSLPSGGGGGGRAYLKYLPAAQMPKYVAPIYGRYVGGGGAHGGGIAQGPTLTTHNLPLVEKVRYIYTPVAVETAPAVAPHQNIEHSYGSSQQQYGHAPPLVQPIVVSEHQQPPPPPPPAQSHAAPQHPSPPQAITHHTYAADLSNIHASHGHAHAVEAGAATESEVLHQAVLFRPSKPDPLQSEQQEAASNNGGGDQEHQVVSIEFHAPVHGGHEGGGGSHNGDYKELPEFQELSALMGKSPEDQFHGLTYLLAKEMQTKKSLQRQQKQLFAAAAAATAEKEAAAFEYSKLAAAVAKASSRPQDSTAPIMFPVEQQGHQQQRQQQAARVLTVHSGFHELHGGGGGGGGMPHAAAIGGHGGGGGGIGNHLIGMAKTKEYIPIIEHTHAQNHAAANAAAAAAEEMEAKEAAAAVKAAPIQAPKAPPPSSFVEFGLGPSYAVGYGMKTPSPKQMIVGNVIHHPDGGSSGTHEQMELGKGLQFDDGHELQYASKYAFGYRIRDFHTGNDFGHKQNRDLDGVTRGQYHILLPDGRIQNVIYHADDTGFHADVSFETGH